MNTFAAIALGLLLGWLAEWIIDWLYWRRRAAKWRQEEVLLRERLQAAEARSADLEHRLSIQSVNLASLQEKLSATGVLPAPEAQTPPAGRAAALPEETPPIPARSMPAARDDLEAINGIGPVIAGKLNQAGICTFAALAALTPERLRELTGDAISRLADEESIIEQAKRMAAEK